MSKHGLGLSDLGPAPKSSVDWFTTRRPGRRLDAAEVGLGRAPSEHRRALGVKSSLAAAIVFLFGL
jgi:hypothetical protein